MARIGILTRSGAALLAAAGLLGACGTAEGGGARDGGEGATREAVVVPREGRGGGPGSAPLLDAERADQVVEEVRELLARRDFAAVGSRVQEALEAGVPQIQAAELRRLEALARRKLLETTQIQALVVPDSRRVTLGDPVTGELILANVGRESLEIPAGVPVSEGSPERSRSTVYLELLYEEFGCDGTRLQERRTRSVELGEDLVLEPGRSRGFPLSFDTLEINPSSCALRHYRIKAVLYPAEIHVGGQVLHGPVPFTPALVRVFPRGYRHLEEHPVRRLEEAVRKCSPVHVPLAAALVPEERREEAIRVLRRALLGPGAADHGPTRVSCCVALGLLTGSSLAPRPELWERRLRASGER